MHWGLLFVLRPEISNDIESERQRKNAVPAEALALGQCGLQGVARKDGFRYVRNEVGHRSCYGGRSDVQCAIDISALVGTDLQVRAVKLAARQFRDAADRERFVSQVRSALADGVARGEPLPPAPGPARSSYASAPPSAFPRECDRLAPVNPRRHAGKDYRTGGRSRAQAGWTRARPRGTCPGSW